MIYHNVCYVEADVVVFYCMRYTLDGPKMKGSDRMKQFILEACVDSVESAIHATNAGANRLELCGNLILGGTTPTLATFLQVKRECDVRIHVLIRPRFGDFCYSNYEMDIMKEEIRQFREAGADGIVIGILQRDGQLDCNRMRELIEEAGDMSITLHRAFDVCKDPYQVLSQAKQLGIHTILTSGQANQCSDGAELIKELIEQSDGVVDLLVGGGVNADTIERMYRKTGATSYHMSGKVILQSPMQYRNPAVSMGLAGLSEYEIWQTNEEYIREAVHRLQQL